MQRVFAILLSLFALSAIAFHGSAAPIADAPRRDHLLSTQVGVYYFPGWFRSPWTSAAIWDPIRPYPDRRPTLGWYDPRTPAVLRQQLTWMHDYKLDYVVFDWTYSSGEEHLGQVIDTYLGIDQSAVKFAILWANHDEATKPQDMRKIVDIWLSRYLRSPKFLTVEGKPVIFLFSFQKFRDDANASGSSAHAYIAAANAMARRSGLPGLYFVGGVDDTSSAWVGQEALASGINAISTYNFHRKPEAERDRDPNWGRAFYGYRGLDASYRAQWSAALTLPVDFIVPMSSGWDKRPWGGSDDPKHDQSIGTDAAFRAHLQAGRAAIEQFKARGSPGMGVICCWNEFGEGSFIEPTTRGRFGKLDQVRSVFGR